MADAVEATQTTQAEIQSRVRATLTAGAFDEGAAQHLPGTPLPPQIEIEELALSEATEVTAVAVAGSGLSLSLEDGAQILIAPGRINPGHSVTMRSIPASEWSPPVPDGVTIGSIYEITASEPTSALGAMLTLPIETEGLTAEEVENFRLAYYNNGSWISLPSTTNVVEGTVSGTVNHVTRFALIRRLFDKPPHVVIQPIPAIYTGRVNERQDANFEDLWVDIYAVDPEDQELTVHATFSLETLAQEVTAGLLEIKDKLVEQAKKACKAETDAHASCDALFQVLDEGIVPLPEAPLLTMTNWLSLNEIEPGHYRVPFQVSGLELKTPLEKIIITVEVWDAVEGDPVEYSHTVLVDEHVPHPVHLIAPGPSALTFCPPKPRFFWSYGKRMDLAKESRFRVVKGDDVWGSRADVFEWECESSGCGKDGPDSKVVMDWPAPRPMRDGVYSWGIELTGPPSGIFGDQDLIRSSEFQFTVDDSLTGETCIQRVNNRPNWVELTANGGLVNRSEVKGDGRHGDLSWEIYYDDERVLSRRANEEMVLDLPSFVFNSSMKTGVYTVWVNAEYRDSIFSSSLKSYRISNIVVLEIVPTPKPTRTPTRTPSPANTPTRQPTRTPSPANTPTRQPTRTPTVTWTPTPQPATSAAILKRSPGFSQLLVAMALPGAGYVLGLLILTDVPGRMARQRRKK